RRLRYCTPELLSPSSRTSNSSSKSASSPPAQIRKVLCSIGVPTVLPTMQASRTDHWRASPSQPASERPSNSEVAVPWGACASIGAQAIRLAARARSMPQIGAAAGPAAQSAPGSHDARPDEIIFGMLNIPLALLAALALAPASTPDKFWLEPPDRKVAVEGSLPAVIEGVLLDQTDKQYHVRVVGGELWLDKAKVVKLEKGQ